MNLAKPPRSGLRLLYSLFLRCRSLLPRIPCHAFSGISDASQSGIGPIFVINLDRQPNRWAEVVGELDRIYDSARRPLSASIVRYSAFDAQADLPELVESADVDPFYTLADQLFVEPQPHAKPDAFDLHRPIRMSRAEIAVAYSHIDVWRLIAQSSYSYALVLEDDVYLGRRFGRALEEAWREMEDADRADPKFDVLYVSYKEVRHGAPKELVSRNIFVPERGLWYLSGYVLSRKGARALLDLLPCRGPIDLWINHKFREIDVRALRRSWVNQRRDFHSTNSYSILPMLSRIGILDDSDASLFHRWPQCSPVFAFGDADSGLSSLAMALSMLGYRCCSDFDDIPQRELESLLLGDGDSVFNAYVNVGSLESRIRTLKGRYPDAKFIVVGTPEKFVDALQGANVLRLHSGRTNTWRALCEYLRLAPVDAPYPVVRDLGMRTYQQVSRSCEASKHSKSLRYDPSPWVAEAVAGWTGMGVGSSENCESVPSSRIRYVETFEQIDPARWLLRNDTFAGNLGLFRPANVTAGTHGLSLAVMAESLGVRNLSAAAISSRENFLFGRFEVTLQATSVPGLVTGFFLHRDSPRQEIDVELLGNRPDQLLVNVFYNPGTEGAKFDYGYRGTPTIIKLGFDASRALHRFAIEWDASEIRWFVDRKLVHRRSTWAPTPIPHLPMTLHLNTWPTRSRELAGRLALRALPASTAVRHVCVDAYSAQMLPHQPLPPSVFESPVDCTSA